MADPSTYRPASGAIPDEPGVYRFRDDTDRVIYVGKAKSLRSRLSSYFADLSTLHPRTRQMVTTASSVAWTVVGTEVEALQLEYSWIKEYDPRFNVRYRDDKSYPVLAVTLHEEIPRLFVYRGPRRKGVRYFGPYAHAWAIRETLDLLLRVFPARTCSNGVFRRHQQIGRPCLLGYIGKCSAPCVGRVDAEEHRAIVDDFCDFLAGRTDSLVRRLEREMQEASAELEFERAARLRDDVGALRRAMEKQAVVLGDGTDADVIAFAQDELEAAVQIFHVRGGRVRGQRGWVIDKTDDPAAAAPESAETVVEPAQRSAADSGSGPAAEPAETDSAAESDAAAELDAEDRQPGAADSISPVLVSRFLSQFYGEQAGLAEQADGGGSPVPREVLVPRLPEDAEAMTEWLSRLRGGRVSLRVPRRGDKRTLMSTVARNAVEAFTQHKMRRAGDLTARSKALQELQEALALDSAPLRIECIDVSHVQGSDVVASLVVFEDGLPRKSDYRRFAIREGVEGGDVGSIAEVVRRRFARHRAEAASGEQPGTEAAPEQVAVGTDAAGPAASRDAEPPVEFERTGGGDPVDQTEGPTAALATGDLDLDLDTPSSRPGIDPETGRPRRFAYPPNLLVVDGAGPQAAAAAEELDQAGVTDVAVVGLAKRLEEVWVPGEAEPVILPRTSEALYLLQRVRDEAHRFAVGYHRQKRSRRMTTSALDEIPGLGRTRRAALLKHFGSLRRLRAADVAEISLVPGVGRRTAEAVHLALNGNASGSSTSNGEQEGT
ncbi:MULTISPECIES: excinuclease ABC subunit UvrC [Actinoalloteichus]|uniref:UvrABC system protein C n=1 Tax=Actinoalloteichus fjordicus TaxID=1612552 RepID=A0AAC9PS63_9PSEU|nr:MULTISPECIES: excinuclease ABC subunit UvrC [Actinoalloteichus]APU14526.1 Excinuclease ABC subunit C [Actinoalloteichus fjordicus]APU20494.1 Excinuclease ABC subunit C [Actinoalloteichus sp. GBA129-24]